MFLAPIGIMALATTVLRRVQHTAEAHPLSN
jgi:hypothetical protein